MSKKIGIFGGTFDPPHLGHLLLAETIREQLQLDEILFVPCNQPPHKDRPDLTASTHRYAMVVAATLQNPAFSPSPIEVNRPGKSYARDTVAALRQEVGVDTELYFVAGLDSFLAIETWKDYEGLLDACHFVVVSRPNNSFEAIGDVLPTRFQERVVDLRGGADVPSPDGDLKIFLTDEVHFDLSSTQIRARSAEKLSIRYRVTPEVERYVRTHDLYGARAVASESVGN